MNKPLTGLNINSLRMELYCRDIAIRLAAANLLDFFDDASSDELTVLLWCGAGYLPGTLEPDDSWQPVSWHEMPLLADLYNRYGEPGLYFWCAWQRNSDHAQLTEAVQQIYAEAKSFVLRHLGVANILTAH